MTRFDVNDFVAECQIAMSESEPQLAMRDVVSRAVHKPAEIEAALGPSDGWCIQKLFHDADLTILQFVWPPTLDLFPHEHKMWSTVGIYGGTEANTMHRRTRAVRCGERST